VEIAHEKLPCWGATLGGEFGFSKPPLAGK